MAAWSMQFVLELASVHGKTTTQAVVRPELSAEVFVGPFVVIKDEILMERTLQGHRIVHHHVVGSLVGEVGLGRWHVQQPWPRTPLEEST